MSDLAVQAVQAARSESFIDEWERQSDEPKRAFSAFVLFRDMGDERGVYNVRSICGFNASNEKLLTWAKQFRWVERANAYDRMLDRRRQRAHVEAIEEQARRQVQLGQVLQHTGLEWVSDELDTKEKRAKQLNANAALRFIDKGVDLEREGLGVDKPDSATEAAPENVLDAQTKADVFDTISTMAENMAAVEKMIASRGVAPPPPDPIDLEEIIDADVIEDDDDVIEPSQ